MKNLFEKKLNFIFEYKFFIFHKIFFSKNIELEKWFNKCFYQILISLETKKLQYILYFLTVFVLSRLLFQSGGLPNPLILEHVTF